MRALDLFSAAAGGWTLGRHRAGFVTVAACEIVEWRRILYAENNPDVRLYEDVRGLTAARLVSDLGFLPDIVVGSPPCQDISSANTKGRGIDGERSGLYLEAVRLVGDCRPRWFAFENSPNLRTRGADRLLDALAALGYACEPCVVGAGDLGANHERKRSWLLGFDPDQLAARAAGDAAAVGCGPGRPGGCAQPDHGPCQPPCGDAANAGEAERRMDAWSPAYDRRKSPTMDAVLDAAMTGRAPDRWTYARSIATLLKAHGLTGPSQTLPVTYGWMMGYPPGWLTRALRSAMDAGRLPPA